MPKGKKATAPKMITEFFLDDFRREGSVIFIPYACGEVLENRVVPIDIGKAAALKFLELVGPETVLRLVAGGRH